VGRSAKCRGERIGLTLTTADEAVAIASGTSRGGVRSELIAAASILTRFPVSSRGESVGASAFGLVGALIGAAAGVVMIVLGSVAPAVAAIGAVAVMLVLSGALHLDGLADTADALVAPTEEAAERARLDPRAGAAAVAIIVVILIADWSLISTLITRRDAAAAAAAVISGAAVSRAVAALVPSIEGRGFRPGFGSWFAERVTVRDGLVSAATAIVLAGIVAFVLNRPGLAVAGVLGLAGGLLWCRLLARLRHGLDGDAIGAIVELTLTTTLLAAVLAA
jgi:adenosylcobinamide-GDP ribazoletransferase